MTGNIFLLEIYNEKTITTISAGHQFAVVDMANKTFKWVTGLPAKNLITSGTETGGVPMYHQGSIWLPITEFGKDAALYTVYRRSADGSGHEEMHDQRCNGDPHGWIYRRIMG